MIFFQKKCCFCNIRYYKDKSHPCSPSISPKHSPSRMEHSPTNPFPHQADKNKCIKCSTCPGVHCPGLQGVSDQTKCPHSPKKSEKLSPSGARSPYSPTGSAHYKISNSKHSPTSTTRPSSSPEQQNCKHNLRPSKPQESSAKKSPLYSKNKHHTRDRI